MQYKTNDRVEIKNWMVSGYGTVLKDCLEHEITALIKFDSGESIWIPTDNLGLAADTKQTVRYVWRNNTLKGFYSESTTALVVAESKWRATELLNAELRSKGLPGDVKPEEVFLVLTDEERVIILNDGEY